jgi:hypothetical protein
MAGRPRSRGPGWMPSTRHKEPFTSEGKIGNLDALRHGALSPRLIEPRAIELVGALVALAHDPDSSVGYLKDPAYQPAIRAWARVESSLERLDAYLSDVGLLDDEGPPRPATRLQDRMETRSESLRARLGLDPLSRARLGRDVAGAQIDVAKLFAEMHDDGEDEVDVDG